MVRLIPLLVVGLAVYLLARGPAGLERLRKWRKPVLVVLLALVYARSPIDLVPDVSPVGLLDDLLVLIGALWWARRTLQTASGRPRAERPAEKRRDSASSGWDPYAVLGVPRGSSGEQITHAYRQKMKRYHPDRVNDLGEELQQLAHEKTIEIQRAYRELR